MWMGRDTAGVPNGLHRSAFVGVTWRTSGGLVIPLGIPALHFWRLQLVPRAYHRGMKENYRGYVLNWSHL
jgi:hypothetical protein